jgi:hypothetical protein
LKFKTVKPTQSFDKTATVRRFSQRHKEAQHLRLPKNKNAFDHRTEKPIIKNPNVATSVVSSCFLALKIKQEVAESWACNHKPLCNQNPAHQPAPIRGGRAPKNFNTVKYIKSPLRSQGFFKLF